MRRPSGTLTTFMYKRAPLVLTTFPQHKEMRQNLYQVVLNRGNRVGAPALTSFKAGTLALTFARSYFCKGRQRSNRNESGPHGPLSGSLRRRRFLECALS